MLIKAECSCCGKIETYEMNKEEEINFFRYQIFGRDMGTLQDLFPKIPAWIRSGAIDQYSGGFCICPDCCGD